MLGTSENQIIRWAIPGWTTLVMFLLLEFEKSILGGDLAPLAQIVQFGGDKNSLAGLFVATVSGVPLGFLIYQIYFYFRWNWPGSSRGSLYRWSSRWKINPLRWFTSRGRMDEIDDFILKKGSKDSEILLDDIGKVSNCHACDLKDAYSMGKHRDFWPLLECIWTEATAIENGAAKSVWAQRGSALFDTLHGLGAARWSVVFGFLLFCLYQAYVCCRPSLNLVVARTGGMDALTYVLAAIGTHISLLWPSIVDNCFAVVVTMLTTYALWYVLTRNRDDVMQRIGALWHDRLRTHIISKNGAAGVVLGDNTSTSRKGEGFFGFLKGRSGGLN